MARIISTHMGTKRARAPPLLDSLLYDSPDSVGGYLLLAEHRVCQEVEKPHQHRADPTSPTATCATATTTTIKDEEEQTEDDMNHLYKI